MPKSTPEKLTLDQGRNIMQVFADTWKLSESTPGLRQGLAQQIADVARKVRWEPQDIPLLQTHYKTLKKGGYSQADTVQSAINDVAVWK